MWGEFCKTYSPKAEDRDLRVLCESQSKNYDKICHNIVGKTIKLNKYYQQIILACKGWSKIQSVRNTIERILSQYLGISRKHINQRHVYYCLIEIVKEVQPNELERLYENLFRDRDSISVNEMINRLISILGNVRVIENHIKLIELEYNEKIMNGICGSEV